MPPPGKTYLLVCSSHTVSRDVSSCVGEAWAPDGSAHHCSALRNICRWQHFSRPRDLHLESSLYYKGIHAETIISSAAWMGNLLWSDGKCALSPLYFLFTVLASFLGVGGRGDMKFKDLMRNQFEQQFLTDRVNLPFCKLIFVTSYLYDAT